MARTDHTSFERLNQAIVFTTKSSTETAENILLPGNNRGIALWLISC
jgi:hypothetical protein